MSSGASVPVVLGSSFSGLLVSLHLSRAGVAHRLVGGSEPGPEPRLGESLIETTGPEIWRLLGPEVRAHCFKKNHISLFDGPRVSLAHIGNPRERLRDVAAKVIGRRGVRAPFFRTLLVHVDRGALDPLLYRAARRCPECEFLDGTVSRVETTEETRVRSVCLEDGRVLERPRAVFDAMGARSPVAEAFGLETIPLSARQRVAWRHRARPFEPVRKGPWWQHGTNLVRLRPEIDGLTGIAWVIPLGARVSLGLSVEAADASARELDGSDLVARLEDACARRGVDLRAAYPEALPVRELSHCYARRSRAWGPNWLLVGGTCQQIWFPSSTGVWTSTAAAGLAPLFVEDPSAAGRRYVEVVDGLRAMHAHMAHMIHEGWEDDATLAWFWGRWLAFVPRRLAQYLSIANPGRERPGILRRAVHRATHVMLKRPRLHQLAFTPWIRIAQPRRLELQADAFPDYFAAHRFRLRSLCAGLPTSLLRRTWPVPWTVRHDGPPTPHPETHA